MNSLPFTHTPFLTCRVYISCLRRTFITTLGLRLYNSKNSSTSSSNFSITSLSSTRPSLISTTTLTTNSSNNTRQWSATVRHSSPTFTIPKSNFKFTSSICSSATPTCSRPLLAKCNSKYSRRPNNQAANDRRGAALRLKLKDRPPLRRIQTGVTVSVHWLAGLHSTLPTTPFVG